MSTVNRIEYRRGWNIPQTKSKCEKLAYETEFFSAIITIVSFQDSTTILFMLFRTILHILSSYLLNGSN